MLFLDCLFYPYIPSLPQGRVLDHGIGVFRHYWPGWIGIGIQWKAQREVATWLLWGDLEEVYSGAVKESRSGRRQLWLRTAGAQISGFGERQALPWLLPVLRAQAGSGGTPVLENRFENLSSLCIFNISQQSQNPFFPVPQTVTEVAYQDRQGNGCFL